MAERADIEKIEIVHPAARATSLSEVRVEIDRIDANIIALLGERARYAERAGQLKPNAAAVRVPERERQVIERACELAVEHGLKPDFAAQLYRMIIDHFANAQIDDWTRRESYS